MKNLLKFNNQEQRDNYTYNIPYVSFIKNIDNSYDCGYSDCLECDGWLSSDGTAYILPGITTSDEKLRCTVTFINYPQSSGWAILGARDSATWNTYGSYVVTKGRLDWSAGGWQGTKYNFEFNTIYTLVCQKGYYSVNGIEVMKDWKLTENSSNPGDEASRNTTPITLPHVIFGINTAETIQPLKQTIQSVKYEYNNEIIRDMIACRVSKSFYDKSGTLHNIGEVGLYDKINNILYKNANSSGSFSYSQSWDYEEV